MKNRVKFLLRRFWRPGLVLVLLACLLGVIAPFVNAAAFSGKIERALQNSLGRKVTFSRAYFTLFTGPGFSLEDVTIQEDPRYGFEPFAHVPKLEARLRIDRLLLGHIVFSSLRLVEPSLNLVKRDDGTWNVVELINRLSTPSKLPINLFPAVQVSDGRIDFKFGMRKTLLYITDTDLSIYPELSGKLYVRFSGSPARTDRAGYGFGHLRGAANLYLKPISGNPNRLEADVALDPSNLSELTTLVQGEDAGIHGTVSSHVRIEGPATALHLLGEVHLNDVHRWDLLPASGEDWRIQYEGNIDLVAHRLSLETLPSHSGEPSPVVLLMRVNDFLRRPAWSVLANFNHAPAQDLLPLSRRMGLGLPDDLALQGTLSGAVGYSSNNDLSGGVSITGVTAKLPNLRPLRAGVLIARISPDHIRFEPATIETESNGNLRVGGDYNLATHRSIVSLSVDDFSIEALSRTFRSWFGVPPALTAFKDGIVTGKIGYSRDGTEPPSWSGQFRFAQSTLALPGFAEPLLESQGRVEFDNTKFTLDRFSAHLGKQPLTARFRFDARSSRPQRVAIDIPSADLGDIETALEPTLQAQGFLARLGVTGRAVPAWLTRRDLQGDLTVGQFSIDKVPVGELKAHFSWLGTGIAFSTVRLSLPAGAIDGTGEVSLAASLPRYRFEANVNGFPWKGGTLTASGHFQTYGLGSGTLEHLRADGTFAGDAINLSSEDQFQTVSGSFRYLFVEGRPDLRLANLEASQNDEAWTGVASTQNDGTLLFELESAGRQRRIISTLDSQSPSALSFQSRDVARVAKYFYSEIR